MRRIFHIIADFAQILRAAAAASAAAQGGRQPASADLKVLGISDANFRAIRA